MAYERNAFSSFEWDEGKRLSNLTKHRIDFKDAAAALQLPHLEMRSDRNGEVRTLAICMATMRIIAVVYTMRDDVCRIISARAARSDEKGKYFEIFSGPDP